MDSAISLRILYDNTLAKEGFVPGWGFSALVQWENKQILFDSGADPQILSRNINQLDSPVAPNRVVISHPHCDHVGGLSAVLKEVSYCPVDLPSSTPEDLTHKVNSYGCNPVPRPEPDKITKGLHTTGALETAYRGLPLCEQGLIVEGTKGPILVAGRSHPGIEKMVEAVSDYLGQNIYLVVGGFHLASKEKPEVETLLEKLRSKVEKVCPTHCTGEEAIELFREGYGQDFISGGAGRSIDV